jgi:hypothetical protein
MPICVAMAISRPLLLALIGAVLLAATFLTVQNARNNGSQEVVPAAQQSEPAEPPAGQAEPSASPVDTLKSALSGKLDSAAFDLQIEFAGGGEPATVRLSGAFERGAPDDIPAFDLHADVNAVSQSFEGGFAAVDEKAYFTQGDGAWRVPAEAWDPLVQAVANGAGAGQKSPAFAVHPETWVRDAKAVGEEDLDGVETTHVSASVDVQALVRDVTAAAPGNAAKLPAPREIAGLVERAEFDAWVGPDQILRRLTARLAFDVPERLRGSGQPARGGIDVALNLSGVNKAQHIEAPSRVLDGLPRGEFGRFVQGFTAGLSGVTGGEPVSLAALSTGNPRRAARAVKAGKKVVIFFRNPSGLDDRAVAGSVRAVARGSNAVVLTDHVDAVERYGKLVEDLGVSQTPSVVLIDRAGDARLIEGFIDPQSLTQAVADAR